jgi:predicted enzyme related to lactoylglutathione lyase
MPTRDTNWPNGTPCWIDYGAADIAAAKAFYSEVLGWTYEGGDDPQYGGYLTCQTKGRAAAGMAPQQDPNDPPKWMTYFAADDLDATAKRITEAGGTLLFEPMDVGPMGRMVIARDPQGHPFGVWQGGEHTGARIYNEPGSLVWNEAAVDDPRAAQEFYSAVFGFTFEEFPGMDGYHVFKTDERPLGGLSAHQPGTPKGWITSFSVASTDDAVAAAEKAGGKITSPAQDASFGRFASIEDPWGAPFSVMQELPG